MTTITSVTLGTLLSLFLIEQSQAIPAFARRYETSCQTCHLVYPRLTPFGEAFRRNAYRFPEQGDELVEKQSPIELGAEAQRELYPRVVYPGRLPGSLPLSMVVDGNLAYGRKAAEGHSAGLGQSASGEGDTAASADEHKHFSAASTTGSSGKARDVLAFGQANERIGLRAAGSLGPLASLFASIDVGGHSPIAIERANLTLTPLGQTALLLKVGRFEPALHGVSIHRGVLGHQLRLGSLTVYDNPFLPEPSTSGIEAAGTVLGRAGWNLGVVENSTPDHYLLKDSYARIEYKLGGMRLDGLGAEAQSASWREYSLLLGASALHGKAHLADLTTAQDDEFMRYGLDAHATLRDVLLDVVGYAQLHDRPSLGSMADGSLYGLYAELSMVPLAILIPTVRVDISERSLAGKGEGLRWQALAALTKVVRPNILARLEGGYGKDASARMETRYAAFALSAAF